MGERAPSCASGRSRRYQMSEIGAAALTTVHGPFATVEA